MAKKFTCPKCSRKFDSQRGLSIHQSLKHKLNKSKKIKKDLTNPVSKENKKRIESILAESLKKEIKKEESKINKIKKLSLIKETKKESPKPQHEFLTNSPQENKFFLINGGTISNLLELTEKLEHMDENVFHYHVNEQKNDFANWVKHVFQKESIAKKISQQKDKKDMQITLLKEIVKTSLKKP